MNSTLDVQGLALDLEMPISVLKTYQDRLQQGTMTTDELTALHNSLNALEEMVFVANDILENSAV